MRTRISEQASRGGALTVVDLAGAVRRSREEITPPLRLENPAGPLPAGDIAVSAGTYRTAHLGHAAAGPALPDLGTVRATVDGENKYCAIRWTSTAEAWRPTS